MSRSRFVWYDLMTTDSAAALAFYGDVLGWTARDAGMPHMTYHLLSVDGHDVGGLMAMPAALLAAGARPAWMGHVGVADVDAMAAAFAAHGGAVRRPPEDIPGVGRFAIVADPQGAVLSLFHPKTAYPTKPAVAPGLAGHIGWHELHAVDGAAAFDFYAARFGWTRDAAINLGPHGMYQMFGAGDLSTGGPAMGGMMTRMDPSSAPGWLFYVNVPAIDAAAAKVREGGGAVLAEPSQVAGGHWIVPCRDPQGATFAMAASAR